MVRRCRVSVRGICVGVVGEVVETASDPLRSAAGEQPVVCEGSEEFPGVDDGDAGQVGDLGRGDPSS